MTILDTLKADQLTARKTHDRVAASLLTTLIGEASKVSGEEFKKGQTTITDDKVVTTIKKFLGNAHENKRLLWAEFTRVMGHAPDDGKTRPLDPAQRPFMESIGAKLRDNEREIAILTGYAPRQMTNVELVAAIGAFRKDNPGANIGQVMAHLKERYAGHYDGKTASDLARNTA